MKNLLLISLAVLLPAMAQAQAKDADVLLRLNHLHDTPTMAQLEELTPDARKVVERTALTSNGIGQVRAIHVLASTGDEQAFQTLSGIFKDAGTLELTKHEILRALVRHFGDRALPHATTWLQDQDLQRRLTAIEALGELDSKASLTALERRLDGAQSNLERQAIERAMLHVR